MYLEQGAVQVERLSGQISLPRGIAALPYSTYSLHFCVYENRGSQPKYLRENVNQNLLPSYYDMYEQVREKVLIKQHKIINAKIDEKIFGFLI